MTEEIIIDGIDVSGCSIFNNKTKVCMYSRETCNAICDYGCYARNEIIERLEQENKELLETLTKGCYQNLQHECRIWELKESKYRSALEEIKSITDKFDYWNSNLPKASEIIDEVKDKINEVLQ